MEKKSKKLIAVDGNSLMHRAYYALPSMSAKTGVPTGAIYGFIGMLLKLIDTKPDYLAVAFDMHGPTFRHEDYPEYKAGRRPTPDDLRTQFPLLKRLLGDMGVRVIECERYEADDILGTLSRMCAEEGAEALLVTGDRDALQLVSPSTHVLMTKKGLSETVEYDEAELFAQYGLTPARMIDLKALMGDSSDNIPGIAGIGEKTALKLLGKYGDLESVLAHFDDEKGALRERLKNGGDSARMSFKLGTIDTRAPIRETLKECAFDSGSLGGGVPLMRELELRSLIGRLPDKGEAVFGGRADAPVEHIRVDSLEALSALADKAAGAKLMAFAAGETLSVSFEADTEYDVVLGATLLDSGLDEGTVFSALAPSLGNGAIKKVVFDSKKLRHGLAKLGTELRGAAFDAMIADYLLHAIHPAPSLGILAAERLGGGEAGAAALLRLYAPMRRELDEKGLASLFETVEMPLVDVLYDMEKLGFRIDTALLAEMSAKLRLRIDELAKGIYSLAEGEFNILSTKQLGAVLFDKLRLPTVKKTKTGYSTDSEVLETIYDEHPIVPMVLEYRTLTKLVSTFLDGLLAMVEPESGRVHTRFYQNVASTGRISSAEPNLQNIPVRTELGREIRKAFIASEGNILVDADYSQIELRLLACMSGDEGMIRAFTDGADIHRRTASEVFSVPFEQVTGAQRSAAKAVNFGIVYGISDFGLARQLGISRKEAARYIELYFARYPGVKRFLTESVEKAKRDGYAVTLMGRRREMPELTSSNYNTRAAGERIAMNMPIQGTAADVIKLAMVRVQRALDERGLRARLILQIHDELIIDAPEEEVEEVKKLLTETMEGVMTLPVPLSADAATGRSWFEAK